MQEFFTNVFILFSALLSVAVGYLFDVPPALLWLAAIGSAGGVAISKPHNPLWGFILIFAGTFAIGQLMSVVAHYWPSFPQKPVAFFAGLIAIGYRQQIKQGALDLVVEAFAGAKKFIAKSFAKVGGEK